MGENNGNPDLHTRSGFLLLFFYTCKTILSLFPIQARGKDKMQPHVGCTSIRYVIVMLQLRHHVASQCTQDFLEAFFMFFSRIK